jgi:hypothetical protein
MILLGVLLPACGEPEAEGDWPQLTAVDAPNDGGGAILLLWKGTEEGWTLKFERAPAAEGPWTAVGEASGADAPGWPAPKDGEAYWYRARAYLGETELPVTAVTGPVTCSAQVFDTSKLMVFLTVVGFATLMIWFVQLSRRNPDIYVRPIGGLAAVNEAIGRATEMGRPILFVPGIADLDDPQTIAAIVILKEVAKRSGEYSTPVLTPCKMPVVMTAAEEATKAGYLEAGQPDLYQEDHVRFLSDDQFAYCAGVNGIMLREKPATNIYVGAFWAESLILAETGFDAGAIQIAGTANVSQLPFFVAACDYTLIGEELYAASAYLSREPKLLGALKASDWAKVAFAAAIILGIVLQSAGIWPAFKAFFQ